MTGSLGRPTFVARLAVHPLRSLTEYPPSLTAPRALPCSRHSHTFACLGPSLVTHAYTLSTCHHTFWLVSPPHLFRDTHTMPTVQSYDISRTRCTCHSISIEFILFLNSLHPSRLVRYRVSATLSSLSRIFHLSVCSTPMTTYAAASQAPFFFSLALRSVNELPAYLP